MQPLSLISLALATALVSRASSDEITKRASQINGIDVSEDQPNIDWGAVRANGIKFVYIKATEGLGQENPEFVQQYIDAGNAGLIRGAYHSGRPGPGIYDGMSQAKFFVAHGGRWNPYDYTLPGAVVLDGDCGGLSQVEMVEWIRQFTKRYHSRNRQSKADRRYPTMVIKTTTRWWQECTGNSIVINHRNRLWITNLDSSPGELPAAWSDYTFWQYANSSNSSPGHQNFFKGDYHDLTNFAYSSVGT